MLSFREFITEAKHPIGSVEHLTGLVQRYWKHKGISDHMKNKPRLKRAEYMATAQDKSSAIVNQEFVKHYSHLVDPSHRKGFDLANYGHPDKHGGPEKLALKIWRQKYTGEMDL